MITKEELSNILHNSAQYVNEGVVSFANQNHLPSICYWEYLWHDAMASGDQYETVVTYQISMLSKTPRPSALFALKKNLNAAGLHPDINHEYDVESKLWHFYLAVDVLEEI